MLSQNDVRSVIKQVASIPFTADFELNVVKQLDNGSLIVQGYGLTYDQDRDKDEVDPNCVKEALRHYHSNPVLLLNHDMTRPIGKVLQTVIDIKGIFITAEVTRPIETWAKEAYQKIKDGVYKAFSFGGLARYTNKRIVQLDLVEFSVVSVPSNPVALFSVIQKSMETISYVEKPYPNEHACRLREPNDFQPNSFRRVERTSDGKSYSVIMGRLKDEDSMTEQAYRYSKDEWSAQQARSHCTSHNGKTFEAAEVKNVSTNGLAKLARLVATFADNEQRILAKSSRVLSGDNEKDVVQARNLLNTVLDRHSKALNKAP